MSIQVYENKILPAFDAHWHQAILRAVKIANPFKFHHALQRAVISVGPSVIGAPKLFRATRNLGHHGGRMMPAHVIKRTQLPILTARHHDWFAGDLRREKLAALARLSDAAHRLP